MAKLNIQALSRQNKYVMRSMIADEGKVFVSVDLAAGEPTVIAEYSKDPIYKAVTFDMVGKDPYYNKQGILLLDDIYLAGMSVSPMGKALIRELFDNGVDGVPFVDQWRKDKEVIQKKVLKKARAFHKILMLGLGYSMGPKKMVKQAFNAGFKLTVADSKAFFKAYWNMFEKVANLRDTLAMKYEREGRLVNQFGYALYPDSSHKALNYWIQSSVSGIVNLLCHIFFTKCKYAEFVTIIHDEKIFQIPEDKVDETKKLLDESVEELNKILNWSVKIKVGFVVGKNLYEAK